MGVDQIERVSEGDLLSAARDLQILEALGREVTGPGVLADNAGWHQAGGRKGKRLRPFELAENLVFGGSAAAYGLQLAGGVYTRNTNDPLTVYDPFSEFCQNDYPDGQDGARGHAELVNGRLEIVKLQHQARWITFTVNDVDGFEGSDAQVTVDDTTTYRDGYEPNTDVTTVYNTGWAGEDDDTGTAMYDPAEDKYYITAMNLAMVKEDVVTEFEVDTVNLRVQTKTRELFVTPSAAETGWDIHQGDDCV